MVPTADDKLTGSLLLEMASNTQILISLRQHLGIHSAVRIVADGASFPDGFMFEDKGSALREVTLAAGVPLRGE